MEEERKYRTIYPNSNNNTAHHQLPRENSEVTCRPAKQAQKQNSKTTESKSSITSSKSNWTNREVWLLQREYKTLQKATEPTEKHDFSKERIQLFKREVFLKKITIGGGKYWSVSRTSFAYPPPFYFWPAGAMTSSLLSRHVENKKTLFPETPLSETHTP